MIDIAFKNIRYRKTRSILCIIGVTICVFLLMTVDGMLNSMHEELNKDMARYMGKIFLQQPGAGYPAFSSSVNQSIVSEVLSHEDLNPEECAPILFLVLVPGNNPLEFAKIIGMGVPQGKENVYLGDTKARSGSRSLPDDIENAIILGYEAALHYDASIGKDLKIHNNTFYVLGILEYTSIHNIDAIVLMSLLHAQKIYDREGSISTILLTANDIDDVDEIAHDLENHYPYLEAMTNEKMREDAESMMEMPNNFMGMISTVVFFVSIVIIMNVMMMAIKERTKDIGTLRAIGAGKRTILITVIEETLILSIIGGMAGILISIPAAYLLDWAWILSTGEGIKIAFLVLVVGMFSGLYPAYKATKVSPLEALRYE